MKMTMKVMVAAVALVASGLASATAVCVGSEAATGLKDVTAVTGKFIKRGFKLACSKNIELHYDENVDAAWVAAGSLKGVTVYGGTTEGGGGSIALFKAATGAYVAAGDVSGTALANAKTRTAAQ